MQDRDQRLREAVQNHPHYNGRTGKIEKRLGGLWTEAENYYANTMDRPVVFKNMN